MKAVQMASDRSVRAGLLLCLVVVTGQSTGCFFELNRSAEVAPGEAKGRAVRDDGTPAAFASVAVEGSPLHTTAAADGTFSLKNVPEGTHRLVLKEDANGDGWPERSKVIGFRIVNAAKAQGLLGAGPAELSGVNFGQVVLDGVVQLSGTVLDEAAAAVNDARVVVVHAAVEIEGVADEVVASSGAIEARAGTGPDGAFLIPAIAAGEFTTFAFGEFDGALLLSDSVVVTRLEGEERLEGDRALVLRATDAPPRTVGFDLVPAPAANTAVVVTLNPAGGLSGEEQTRTAEVVGDGFTISNVPVGPWAVTITAGALQSELFTRFVLPGESTFDLGVIQLGTGGCTDCDCDGDGLRGLPVLEAGHVCGEASVDDGEAIWEACTSQCAPVNTVNPRSCSLTDGRVFDCEDDRDGQADPAERECYGVGKGTDCDGDDICAFEDINDRCPQNQTCPDQDEESVIACVTVDVVVDPTDGGPIDGGPIDAGPIDGGPIDGGPIDAGRIDGGPIDAGPIDGGPIDGGPIDGGAADGGLIDGGAGDGGLVGHDAGVEVDAGGEADAGQPDGGVRVFQIDGGPGLQNGFVAPAAPGWTAVSTAEVFYGKTAAVFTGGIDPISDCPLVRPSQSTAVYLVALFDEAGECSYQMLYDDVFDEPAIASGTDGEFYLAINFTSSPQTPFLLGVDDGGGQRTFNIGEAGLVIGRFGGDGVVVADQQFAVTGGILEGVYLASHPLNAGVTLFGTLKSGGGTARFEFPSLGVATTDSSDAVAVFLTSFLFVDSFFEVDSDADASSVEATGLIALTPTSVGLVGATAGTAFSNTAQPLAPNSAQTFLAEVVSGDPAELVWARRLAGGIPSGAFGPSFSTGGFALAFSGARADAAVVFGDTEGTFGRMDFGTGEPVFSDFEYTPTNGSLAYDGNSDAFITIANNVQGVAAAFFVDGDGTGATEFVDPSNPDLSSVTELEISARGDLVFVLDDGNSAAVWIDPVGPAPSFSFGAALVGTDIALTDDGTVLYIDDGAALVRYTIGDPPGSATELVADFGASQLAIDGSTLIIVNGGQLLSTPLSAIAPVAEVALPPGQEALDLAYDEETQTAYVVIEGSGLFSVALGSGVLSSRNGTTEAVSVAIYRPAPLALVDTTGAATEFQLPGALQLTEVVLGEITLNAAGGTVESGAETEVLPLAVGRNGGGFTVVAGILGDAVAFDTDAGGTLTAAANDFDDQPGFAVEAMIGGFDVNGSVLSASFIDQTEIEAFNVLEQPPASVSVDGSATLLFSVDTESRVAEHLVVPGKNGAGLQWRAAGGGAPPALDATVDAVVNQRASQFDIAKVRDVAIAEDRVYITADLNAVDYFASSPCAVDLSAGGFSTGVGLFAFDGDGNCLFARGYLDVSDYEMVAYPGGGLLTSVVLDAARPFFDTTVGPTTTLVSDAGELTLAVVDEDGSEVTSVVAVGTDSLLATPFVFDDGGFGAALTVVGDVTVQYAGGAETVDDVGYEVVHLATMNADGTKRAARSLVSGTQTPNVAHAAIGLADGELILAMRPEAGDVAGITTTGTADYLLEIFVSDPFVTVGDTHTIENGEVREFKRTPGASQVMAVGQQVGGAATFRFPADLGISQTLPVTNLADFAAIFDIGGDLREVAWTNDASLGITDAALNRYGHATIVVVDNVGPSYTLNFLNSGITAAGGVFSGNGRADVINAERLLTGGYSSLDMQSVETSLGPHSVTSAFLGSQPYLEEVLFLATTDPAPFFEGTSQSGGALTDAPLWIPLSVRGVAGQ